MIVLCYKKILKSHQNDFKSKIKIPFTKRFKIKSQHRA